MRSVLRRVAVAAALIGATAVSAEAQFGSLKVEEIRIDIASLGLTGGVALQAGVPGSVALAMYLNDKLALEPRVGFMYAKAEGASEGSTMFGLGVFAPFYFAGDRGHSGLFVAPGVDINMFSPAGGSSSTNIDFGADVGYKGKMTDRISWRGAATLRDGDSYGDMQIGGMFGFSVWFR